MEHGPQLNNLRGPVTLQYLPSAAHHRANLRGYRQYIRLGIKSMPRMFSRGTRIVGSLELGFVDVKGIVRIY